MADIEMELDIGATDPVDEDLIDYDSDTLDHGADDLEMTVDKADGGDGDVDIEAMDGDLLEHTTDDMVPVTSPRDEAMDGFEQQGESTLMSDAVDADADTHNQALLPEGTADQMQTLDPDYEAEPQATSAGEPNTIIAHDDQTEAVLSEPFDLGAGNTDDGVVVEHESVSVGDHVATDNNATIEQDDVGISSAKDQSATEEPEQELDETQTSPVTTANVDAEHSKDEADEITWEEEPEVEEPPPDGGRDEDEAASMGDQGKVQVAQQDNDGVETQATELSNEDEPSHTQQENEDQNSSAQQGLSPNNATNGLELETGTTAEPIREDDADANQVKDADSDATQYPSITVQYRGEEYPLFSSDASGFFSDIEVLDHSIEFLLSDFRAELGDEIDAMHDLVFQIDELGLEFTEAHQHDTQSAMTLRQILEVFELLVNNHDPNAFRNLYTYLSTKPNAGRRFEFLMESATSGRGLEEVAYSFEMPTITVTSLIAEGDATENGDEVEEPLVDATENGGEVEEPLVDTNENIANAQENGDTGGEVIEYVESNEYHQEAGNGGEPTGEEWKDEDGNKEEEREEEEEKEEEEEEGGGEGGGTLSNVVDQEKQNTVGETDHDLDNVTNAATTDEVVLNSEDHGDFAEGEAEQADMEEADPTTLQVDNSNETNVSSTSHTVQGESEPQSVASSDANEGEHDGGEDKPIYEVNGGTELKEEEEEVAEIDWREEDDMPPSKLSSSTTGEKRGRGEDEAATEDNSDVKRRRS